MSQRHPQGRINGVHQNAPWFRWCQGISTRAHPCVAAVVGLIIRSLAPMPLLHPKKPLLHPKKPLRPAWHSWGMACVPSPQPGTAGGGWHRGPGLGVQSPEQGWGRHGDPWDPTTEGPHPASTAAPNQSKSPGFLGGWHGAGALIETSLSD